MGISNYMGRRAKPTKGSKEQITVSDYMSRKRDGGDTDTRKTQNFWWSSSK